MRGVFFVGGMSAGFAYHSQGIGLLGSSMYDKLESDSSAAVSAAVSVGGFGAFLAGIGIVGSK